MNKMTPLVSVLMPAYNAADNIASAIESILFQTFKNFEFIIVNDGSTDQTLEIINSYVDPRIIVLNNKFNMKIVRSLNYGLQSCKGKYIARMDADDISHLNRLETQVQFLESNPDIGVCGSFQKFIDTKRLRKNNITEVTDNYIKASLIFGPTMLHPTIMMRRDLLLSESDPYDCRHSYCEDYGLWVNLSKRTKLHTLPVYLCDYRWDSKKKWETDFEDLMSALRLIWIEQLSSIGYLCPSNEHMQLHALLAGRGGDVSFGSLCQSLSYLRILYDFNKKTKYLDDRAAFLVFLKTWKKLFKRFCKKNPLFLIAYPFATPIYNTVVK